MSRLLLLPLLCALLHAGLSLRCQQCQGSPFNCPVTQQNCTINQTSCMTQSFAVIAYTPVANFKCLSCEGNSISCASSNLTSLQCVGLQDRCMTISTAYVTGVSGINASRSDVVVKGCGTGNLCGRKLYYNTGAGRIYSEVSCCGAPNCNQGVKTATVDNTPNGMKCYGCNETGAGECKTPTTVSCTGNMTSCMDALGFPRGNTLMRGCVSTDVCYGLSSFMNLQASQKLYCCQGNMCNDGTITNYVTAGSHQARSSAYITGGAVLALIQVLRTLL
ncbi:urokinase plasminogen activator surface receptor-like isoform X2 [Hyperolius riggenbachi]|uniref:urokinase plasminogen activator surface receptor-like isoform X2 n=1 Tax=Hyperolius riggenbachi TaxID=752182 RepID=UPI0035A3BD71